MVLFDGALGLFFLALWLFCLLDVITTPPQRCRNLPKLVWVMLMVVLIDVGSLLWLLAGRPRNGETADQPQAARAGRPGGRFAAGPRPARRASNPDDDDEFLATLQARADEQRRRAGTDGPGTTGGSSDHREDDTPPA